MLAWQQKGAMIALAALICALAAAITTVSLAAESTAPSESARLAVGLAVRAPDIARMPWREPAPRPLLSELPRLVIERSDGSTLVDVVPFDAHGAPIPRALEEVSRALATRNGHEIDVDPRLVELLLTLSLAFDGQPLVLVSGYREPGRGTRKSSYHASGMAADVAIRGVKVGELRKAAVKLGARGVGIYPSYVHVDVRREAPYRWGGGGGRWRPRRR
jgi:hypothetical protein